MKKEIVINETIESEISILSYLKNKGINIASYCNGLGKCGKCRVRIKSPSDLPVFPSESSAFTKNELNEGWRLACLHPASQGMIITDFLEAYDEEIETVTDIDIPIEDSEELPERPVIALDLGTTTLAAALVDPDTKKVLRLASCVNHQKRYGADVISRIEAASSNTAFVLMRQARKDILDLTLELGAALPNTRYVISGNTTMQHIFMGYPCKDLGVYPYTPYDLSLHTNDGNTLLPGISAFVGADIVSGLVACDMDISDELSLFIDLGTNGEMAIGNKDGILTASTAAGPAFEGGNISCGASAIPGAICSVCIKDGVALYSTIGNEQAKGMCGSGVLETVYELLNAGIIDNTGLMTDEYFENGFPVAPFINFTQDDVRKVQLAKAAIKAGTERLIKEYGASFRDISRLYIAGGFGKHVNTRKAAGIGLIPKELIDKTVAVGNTSLKGAVKYILDPSLKDRFIRTAKDSKELILSEAKDFSDLYINSINF